MSAGAGAALLSSRAGGRRGGGGPRPSEVPLGWREERGSLLLEVHRPTSSFENLPRNRPQGQSLPDWDFSTWWLSVLRRYASVSAIWPPSFLPSFLPSLCQVLIGWGECEPSVFTPRSGRWRTAIINFAFLSLPIALTLPSCPPSLSRPRRNFQHGT